MVWTDQPIFFVDFEGSHASGILEYGVATVIRGKVTEARTRLCRPAGRIRPEDTAVHGLAEAALAEQAPFSDEWEYFAGLRERGLLAAHYAGAENSLLKSVWPYPRPSPDFLRPGESILDWGPWIDSAPLSFHLGPQESGQLESVIGVLALQGELDALAEAHCPAGRRRYHAALYDALAGALVLSALARHPRGSGLTLRQVLALSTRDPRKRDGLVQERLW